MAEPLEHEANMKEFRAQARAFQVHLLKGNTRDTVRVKRLIHDFAWALQDTTEQTP